MRKHFSEIPSLQGDKIVLRQITQEDAPALAEFVKSKKIYRYLPTFLFEQKNDDIRYVIDRLYTECLEESLILGIYDKDKGEFCGIAEFYGYRDDLHKISIGYRLAEDCWGKGIATEALRLMIDYLYGQTDIEIITASTMVENKASAKVLMKNGFEQVSSGVGEDWGYDEPTLADKWIR